MNIGMDNGKKLKISVVTPVYNEEDIILDSINRLIGYLQKKEDKYDWEIIVINDGSSDQTGSIADEIGIENPRIKVLHHPSNFRIGQALRYGIKNATGDFIVTLDIDLSYSENHIDVLLDKIIEENAKIAIASPYMDGGRTTNIPVVRRFLSKAANKFLSFSSRQGFSTITGMVRAYDREFVQSLDLKSTDVAIHPEIIYKATLLNAKIIEIPGHLDWTFQKKTKRKSSFQIFKSINYYLLSGFLFRPVIFFILPASALLLSSLYLCYLVIKYSILEYLKISNLNIAFNYKVGQAVATAFESAPHTFIIGGITFILAFQLICIGIISLQNTKYFEELFHINTTLYKNLVELKKDEKKNKNT
jgi:glycosyltransferase involved in cell wall biosynthesis